MKYVFEQTIESEVNRLKQTFARKDFFIEYGYKVLLPEGLSLSKNYSKSELEYSVKKEFDIQKANNIIKEIKKSLNSNDAKLQNYLKLLPFTKPSLIKVILTKYGVGGSYNTPALIIVNADYKINYYETLIHETLHLIIEKPVVQKFRLSHPEKEGLVDWLMIQSKLFEDYKYQNSSSFNSIPPSKNLLIESKLINLA